MDTEEVPKELRIRIRKADKHIIDKIDRFKKFTGTKTRAKTIKKILEEFKME